MRKLMFLAALFLAALLTCTVCADEYSVYNYKGIVIKVPPGVSVSFAEKDAFTVASFTLPVDAYIYVYPEPLQIYLDGVPYIRGGKAVPEGWLVGWKYRKSHVIHGASGAGVGYQIRIKVIYGSGTDDGENVYLDGKCRPDFGDVRFTDDDGVTLLSYWMQEKINYDYAIFWVKVLDDLSSSDAMIYVYYGNPSATSMSDLAGTFVRIINNLVLALPFDEGSGNIAYDKSGYGNNATLYNGATWTSNATYGYALSLDGVDDYAVVGLQPDGSGKPFTVYGWSEITIVEWIYPCWPKANTFWTKFSMIGDTWVDYPSTFIITDDKTNYTWLAVSWDTRKSDEKVGYGLDIIAYKNTWVHVVRRFTSTREISFWVNGVKISSATVPADAKTVLEWNPNEASYPERYKRFVLGAGSQLGEPMKCMYDEVRIYNRALSSAEIADLYAYRPFEVPENAEARGKTLVRKYVSPEPSHGEWGTLESVLFSKVYVKAGVVEVYFGRPIVGEPPTGLFQYLQAGDFLGFITASWTLLLRQVFWVLPYFIIFVPLYIKTESGEYCAIIFILLSGFLLLFMPAEAGAVAMVFLSLSLGLLLYKLVIKLIHWH